MYMCTECFNLFNESTSNNRCPLSNCYTDNSLVWVDNNIADYISELNIQLKLNDFSFRTQYSCGSHLHEIFPTPSLVLTNIFDPDLLSDNDGKIICDHFINQIEPFVADLNRSIVKNCLIKITSPFKIYYSKNLDHKNTNKYFFDRHRVIISDLSYDYIIKKENGRSENNIDRYKKIIQLDIETSFRRFLINLIHYIGERR